MKPTTWQLLVITVGVSVALAPVVAVFEGVPPSAEIGPVAVGAMLLFVPYGVLAMRPGRTNTIDGAALLLLLVGTIAGVLIATRSSTGALAFVWILPLQVAVAVLVVRRRSRRQGEKPKQQRLRPETAPTTRQRIVTGAVAAFAFLAAIFVLFFVPSLWHVAAAVVFGVVYANRDRL